MKRYTQLHKLLHLTTGVSLAVCLSFQSAAAAAVSGEMYRSEQYLSENEKESAAIEVQKQELQSETAGQTLSLIHI